MKTRDFILLYINGRRVEVRGEQAFLMLSDFLRYEQRLTGTKVVCAEGDCGACTVMRSSPLHGPQFEAFNSCIMPVSLMDGSHLVTVEGLRENGELNELQKCMAKCNGAQCGFCTPGFVMALTSMFEKKKKVNEKTVKNYLTGNLCRCTGYSPIIEAACMVDTEKLKTLRERYARPDITKDLAKHLKIPVDIRVGDKWYFSPVKVADAAQFRAKNKEARIFSAATDLGVPMNKGKLSSFVRLGLQQIPELYKITKTGKQVFVGAKVTLTQLEEFVADAVPEFEKFLRIFASPQIKNVATLIGNVANGSPIGDTLPFLQVSNAVVELAGPSSRRKVPFNKFYKGYRKPDIRKGELIVGVRFEIPQKNETLRLFKVSQRRDLDISCVNAGFLLSRKNGVVNDIRIAYGGVGPTVLSLRKTERFLKGQELSSEIVAKSLELIANEIAPRSDVRGQANYRVALSQSLFKKFIAEVSGEIS